MRIVFIKLCSILYLDRYKYLVYILSFIFVANWPCPCIVLLASENSWLDKSVRKMLFSFPVFRCSVFSDWSIIKICTVFADFIIFICYYIAFIFY